jgi:hypothetical protein
VLVARYQPQRPPAALRAFLDQVVIRWDAWSDALDCDQAQV